MLLFPLGYLIGVAFNSQEVAVVLCGGSLLLMLVSSVLGHRARGLCAKSGPWALVGIVAGVLALFLSVAIVSLVFLLG